MRKNTKPTKEQLKELYEAASDFKRVEPWKWLYDGDLICVENPRDQTIGYCSVMGRGGEHYALGVYLGSKGLSGFYQALDLGELIPPHQILHYQDCVMCSFEDRNLLTNDDRKQIKDLGFSFRGRNAWPMFRRYEPGYSPWVINEEECILLTHALRQTLFVAENVLNGQLSMDMEQGKTILRYREKNGKQQWHSEAVQLSLPAIKYNSIEMTDEMLIQKIKKTGNKKSMILQLDTCYMPAPVQEKKGERPYFPRVLIVIEHKSGQILDFEVYESVDEDVSVTLNKLINLCLALGVPKEIQVRSQDMIAILGDFCDKTGIELKLVRQFPLIDEMLEEMAHRF